MFPKGHLESGKDKLTAAKRETEEEVGIKSTDLILINNYDKDYFEINYKFTDKNNFENTKDVFIFAFKVLEKTKLKREDNQDILEVGWYEVSEAKKLLSFNLESLDWAYSEFLKSF